MPLYEWEGGRKCPSPARIYHDFIQTVSFGYRCRACWAALVPQTETPIAGEATGVMGVQG